MEWTKIYHATWLWHSELLPQPLDSPFLERSSAKLGSGLSFYYGLVVVLK
jgi:hypothetical protein